MTVVELSYTGSLYRSRAHHRDSMASILSYTGRVPLYRGPYVSWLYPQCWGWHHCSGVV